MNWNKIRSVLSIIIFSMLSVFLVVTSLLGFKNVPAIRHVLIIALALIWLFTISSTKTSPIAYRPLKDYKTLALLVFLTILPRGLWLASVHVKQLSDFMVYHQLATALAHGTMMFQSYIRINPHIIAYPFLLSIPYRLFGSTVVTAQVFNMILFVGVVLAVFLLAGQYLNRRFAILAAVIIALWPSPIFFTTLVSTEALFTLFLTLCIGLFYAIRNVNRLSAGIALFILLGVVVAVTNSIRPLGLLFLAAIFIYYFLFVTPESRGVKPWIIKLLFYSFFCIGYLAATNSLHYLIVDAVQGSVAKNFLGYYILVGSNFDSGGTWNEADSRLLSSIYQEGKVDPDKANQALLKYALERIRSSPKSFILLQVKKNRAMWQDDSFGIYWNTEFLDKSNPGILNQGNLERITPITNYYYYTILIFCILGSLIGFWKRETGLITLVGLIILGTVLIFMFVEVQGRYHYYALPLFALLAGYGLDELHQAYQIRTNSP